MRNSKRRITTAALAVATLGAVMLAGCSAPTPTSPASGGESAGGEAPPAAGQVVFQIGYENNPGEPIDLALNKWKELVDQQGDGSLTIELYPSSQLGSKSDLVDQMIAGDSVGTLSDGAFYADLGVPDFGIVFGPYLFDTWDDAWKLVESDWFTQQSDKLYAKGIKIISANWVYGERHTLTRKPVKQVSDLAGMKIRVPDNTIQVTGFKVLGATPTPMALGEVYTALQQGMIDGLENPLPVLYNGKFQEVAKYLILDGHVKNATTWICGKTFWESLTPEQQELLVKTGNEAGVYNNQLQEESLQETIELFKAEGVEVFEPDATVMAGFKEAAQAFYSDPEVTKEWTPGLYEAVKAAMGK
ncbi:MAG: C4-dicarboxylate TRAP transporter substrate-binding protein [Propionibacteriaceae bacterium]|jgi:tripartite ATP-independent transporter DctP family solute receptor|nr:C4-dicarboxylate TRAP transporter substrate-binding protein [Propionibacteriaceae bacterium]